MANIFQKYYRGEIKRIQTGFLKNSHFKNIVVPDNIIGSQNDLQTFFTNLHKKNPGRILITYYNHLWEPILNLASGLRLRNRVETQNWLDENDLEGILNLSGFEVIIIQKCVLIPVQIPVLTTLLNKYLANLPVVNSFCLITVVVARPKPVKRNIFSVSIVIPARNEARNIGKIIPSIPKFGRSQEFIFVEGHSKDDTWNEILKVQSKYKNVKAYKQKGTGKEDAVRFGFSKAKGEILIIYDADRTVEGRDLEKFYDALALGLGEFVNGSRLIYPMENQAMRTLNKIGNKIFSILFSWILSQRLKDTLCGTKAFFRKDYENFKHSKNDPFGDFNLIFGAARNFLKIVEIPVRYKERKYGSTNIKRFKHGLMLLANVVNAFFEFKVWR